ncbi:hypothetical protein [Sunxiuqinia indica]|uniref:hypothetical protein n=1 Tax=Sunxiuqinia indica TaxID=2692584 RepID=UPI001357E017|nr:hypothetical protein [Sunxiuqinia indica]
MNALSTFDLYLWNLYVPILNEKSFKNRLLCIIALCYISIYRLPRKFLINYFRGNGKEMVIDSDKLIMRNNVVLNKLTEAITIFKNNGLTEGEFNICQTDVHDPNYKYSVGSFRVNYSIHNESIDIRIDSDYHFQHNPDRLTKHLHNWLYSKTLKGCARSFTVQSSPLTKTFSELIYAKTNNKQRKLPKHVYLV